MWLCYYTTILLHYLIIWYSALCCSLWTPVLLVFTAPPHIPELLVNMFNRLEASFLKCIRCFTFVELVKRWFLQLVNDRLISAYVLSCSVVVRVALCCMCFSFPRRLRMLGLTVAQQHNIACNLQLESSSSGALWWSGISCMELAFVWRSL